MAQDATGLTTVDESSDARPRDVEDRAVAPLAPTAPKVGALGARPQVALTIDSADPLGSARIDGRAGSRPDYTEYIED
jgi:hypothetical protein